MKSCLLVAYLVVDKSLCRRYHQIRMVFSMLIRLAQRFTLVTMVEIIGATMPVVTQLLQELQEAQPVWLPLKLLKPRLVVAINGTAVNQRVVAYLA